MMTHECYYQTHRVHVQYHVRVALIISINCEIKYQIYKHRKKLTFIRIPYGTHACVCIVVLMRMLYTWHVYM